MALGLVHIPEVVVPHGPAQLWRGYQLQPGSSDYPTGGYSIAASDVGLTVLFGAWVIAVDNAEAIAYIANFVLAAGAFGSTPKPQTSIKMLVTQPNFSGTGANNEIPNGTNLSGCTWFVLFLGY